MKPKYIAIVIGSMSLLYGLMSYSERGYRNIPIAFAVIGLGLLLSGIFWGKKSN
jgi:hypothetical protein